MEIHKIESLSPISLIDKLPNDKKGQHYLVTCKFIPAHRNNGVTRHIAALGNNESDAINKVRDYLVARGASIIKMSAKGKPISLESAKRIAKENAKDKMIHPELREAYIELEKIRSLAEIRTEPTCGTPLPTSLYAVEVKGGHVGKGYYYPFTAVIRATNGKEASEKARLIPRVKHHHKYAILSCRPISECEADEINESNRLDPYFHCSNSQEQRKHPEIMNRVVEERHRPMRMKRHKKKRKASRPKFNEYEEDYYETL